MIWPLAHDSFSLWASVSFDVDACQVYEPKRLLHRRLVVRDRVARTRESHGLRRAVSARFSLHERAERHACNSHAVQPVSSLQGAGAERRPHQLSDRRRRLPPKRYPRLRGLAGAGREPRLPARLAAVRAGGAACWAALRRIEIHSGVQRNLDVGRAPGGE